MDVDVGDVAQAAHTGHLPEWSEVESLVEAAHRRCKSDGDGVVADYIPVLAQADPDWFAVCVAEVDGRVQPATSMSSSPSSPSPRPSSTRWCARNTATRWCATGSA